MVPGLANGIRCGFVPVGFGDTAGERVFNHTAYPIIRKRGSVQFLITFCARAAKAAMALESRGRLEKE